ncbi:MAG TPA: hypothetical protein PLL30_09345 [Candidatus Krumholzibacteria bacterium]|nr:hypothetical protein [Candidatus Krumholzibacteria bacterium]HPD71966.1 hypothetical protein [Candidatus Krumholzibacteria bacterium]HRY41101.1 hypothetical protein [Candidatus Krumholzibacteria bacterium]
MLRFPVGCLAFAALCGSVSPPGAPGREPLPSPADSVVVRPIADRYAAGWLHRALFGSDYRDLWTAPIAVPVLDLATFGGGVVPISRGGGQQTTSLRLRAADGQEYYFRSIDKNPAAGLPPELVDTVVASVVQDQTCATFPAGALLVAPLLAAAGVLHGEPRLYVLPDDERLGEFRDLAGLAGILEPRIADGWGGATEVIGGDELLRRLAASPDDRVDARAFLKARLLDILVGDWDRHRDQWSWARFGDERPRRWLPVPRDRDFALVHYEGLVLAAARIRLPQLIRFEAEYPDVLGLTWNGRELDRRLLAGADAATWNAVVAEVQAAITDEVIADAVRRLPLPFQALRGARLADALERRRDALGAVARQFYAMLSAEAEIHATDVDETAVVTVIDRRTVAVQLFRAGEPGAARGIPYFARRFSRDDSREVRLFLGGGQDTVRVEGRSRPDLELRVIGGAGADVVLDPGALGGLRMYDEDPGTVVTGGAPLDSRPYSPPPKRHANEIPPRDWGHAWQPAGLLAAGPDIGVLFGVGRTYTTYGFRKHPYASEQRLRLGFATEPATFRADYRLRLRRAHSSRVTQLALRASGFEVLRFHGFGNEAPATGDERYYRVTHEHYGMWLSVVAPLGRLGEMTAGPVARYLTTDDRPDRFLATLDPYGAGRFGQIGARLDVSLGGAGRSDAAWPKLRVDVGGSVYPPWWDVSRSYGEVHAEAAGTLPFTAPLDPALRLRAGGKILWGPYPFFDAAFIGDQGTVRLGRQNRYAGDASSYGSGELRLTLGRVFLGAPSDVGVFGLVDTGRVYLEGERSRRWHTATGGGVWVAILDRANTISLALAGSEERTVLYFQGGFGF